MSKVFFGNSGAEANEGAIKPPASTASTNTVLTATMSSRWSTASMGRTIATLTATGQGVFHNYFGPFNEASSTSRPATSTP